jgi:hypothetical protein
MRSRAPALVAGALLFVAFEPAAAQPAVMAAPALSSGPVLRAGTEIGMTLLEPLSSRTARQGQRFALEVTNDVSVDGLLVIPRGTRGVGEVDTVIEKGMLGKSGRLAIRPLFVEIGGARILLEGSARGKGDSGLGPVVLAAPLIGLSAAMFSGRSAVIPAGTPIVGRVSRDLPLARP